MELLLEIDVFLEDNGNVLIIKIVVVFSICSKKLSSCVFSYHHDIFKFTVMWFFNLVNLLFHYGNINCCDSLFLSFPFAFSIFFPLLFQHIFLLFHFNHGLITLLWLLTRIIFVMFFYQWYRKIKNNSLFIELWLNFLPVTFRTMNLRIIFGIHVSFVIYFTIRTVKTIVFFEFFLLKSLFKNFNTRTIEC